MEPITIPEAAKVLNIRGERLRDWVNRKYIIPHESAKGRGSKNRLNLWNLYQIKLFEYLLDQKLPRETMGNMIFNISVPLDVHKYLDDYQTNPDVEIENYNFPDFIFIHDDGDGLKFGGSFNYGEILPPFRKNTKYAIFVNFQDIRIEVDALLKGK